MKNLYQELHINIQASLLQICQAYQTLCTKNPQKIFYYTKILNILTNQKYKLIYDAMLTGMDIRLVYYYSSLFILEEEEFVLAEVITWIEQLREFVYDTKFFTQELENFCSLSFLSDGNKIIPPQKIKLKPYFEK